MWTNQKKTEWTHYHWLSNDQSQGERNPFLTLEWILGPHWTSALMYLGNGVGSKNSTKLIWALDSGSKFEVRPRLRSSASTFFSPGIWWMLKKVLYWICLMQTSFIMSESSSVVEKPLLMFASAPVLSEPDWMLMHDSWSLSGFVVNSRNNAKLCKGFPRSNATLKTFG